MSNASLKFDLIYEPRQIIDWPHMPHITSYTIYPDRLRDSGRVNFNPGSRKRETEREGGDRWRLFQHISQLINEDDCLEFSQGRLLLPPLLLLFAIKIQIQIHPQWQWQLQVRDTLVHCNKHLGVCAVITLTCFCQRAIVQSVLAFSLASLAGMPHAPHRMPHAPYLSSNALKSASIGFVLRSAFCRRFFLCCFLLPFSACCKCHMSLLFSLSIRRIVALHCSFSPFPLFPLPPSHCLSSRLHNFKLIMIMSSRL